MKHLEKRSTWECFKPVLFIVLIPLLLILGFMMFAVGKDNEVSLTAENLSLVDSTYNLNKTQHSFGKISQKDGNVETEYELANTGSSDFFVKRLYTSCMCTKAQITFSDGSKSSLNGMLGHGPESGLLVEKTIKAGETVKVRAVFDPNAHGPQGVGFIKRNITIETNLKNSPTIQVSFDADVTK